MSNVTVLPNGIKLIGELSTTQFETEVKSQAEIDQLENEIKRLDEDLPLAIKRRDEAKDSLALLSRKLSNSERRAIIYGKSSKELSVVSGAAYNARKQLSEVIDRLQEYLDQLKDADGDASDEEIIAITDRLDDCRCAYSTFKELAGQLKVCLDRAKSDGEEAAAKYQSDLLDFKAKENGVVALEASVDEKEAAKKSREATLKSLLLERESRAAQPGVVVDGELADLVSKIRDSYSPYSGELSNPALRSELLVKLYGENRDLSSMLVSLDVDANGTVNVYIWQGNRNGGHDHFVISKTGRKTYARSDGSKHGRQNFIDPPFVAKDCLRRPGRSSSGRPGYQVA